MIIEPIAADLDLDEVEVALLNAAVGDYAAEAGVLLLANDGYWLARLRAAGMITVEAEPVGGELWAGIEWAELDAALAEDGCPAARRGWRYSGWPQASPTADRSTLLRLRWPWTAAHSAWCSPRWRTPPAATITALRPAKAQTPTSGWDR